MIDLGANIDIFSLGHVLQHARIKRKSRQSHRKAQIPILWLPGSVQGCNLSKLPVPQFLYLAK